MNSHEIKKSYQPAFRPIVMVFMIAFVASEIMGDWTSFSKVDMSLDESAFTDLAIEGSETLWGTVLGAGAIRYSDGDWENYRELFGDLINDNTLTICLTSDSRGNVWLGTEEGITVIKDGSIYTHLTMSDGLSGDYILSMATDLNDNIWAGTLHKGVNRYNGTSWNAYTMAHGLIDSTVNAIAVDHKNGVWFGTPKGLSYYSKGSWTNYTKSDGLSDNRIYDLCIDDQNLVWIATAKGMSVYNAQSDSWKQINDPQKNTDNIFYAVEKDQFGNMWFGTHGAGAFRYTDTAFTGTYSTSKGLIDNTVNALAIDSNGIVWFGTPEGLTRFENDKPEIFPKNAIPDTALTWVFQGISFSIVDPDNDPVSVSYNSTSYWADFNQNANAIWWTPRSADVGTQNFTIIVQDLNGGSDTLEFSIEVVQPVSNSYSVLARSNRTSIDFQKRNGGIEITYSIGEAASSVSLQLFDMSGRIISSPVSGFHSQGNYTAIVPKSELSGSGNCILRYRTDTREIIKKVTVIR